MNGNTIKTGITDYYAKRASEYEGIYDKPERQEDLGQLQSIIASSFKDLDVLEIACGTGYWTRYACQSAASILAIDYNNEVLDIARQKDYGKCQMRFMKSDAYRLDNVVDKFSAALVGFWWSHIPKRQLDAFFAVLHSRLCDQAKVIVFDNRYVEGSSTPISRIDDEGNSYQIRNLSDRSRYEVLKNFPEADELSRQVGPLSSEFEYTELPYYWLARYTLNKPPTNSR